MLYYFRTLDISSGTELSYGVRQRLKNSLNLSQDLAAVQNPWMKAWSQVGYPRVHTDREQFLSVCESFPNCTDCFAWPNDMICTITISKLHVLVIIVL